MTRKSLYKYSFLAIFIIIAIAGSVAYYLFNMPPRNVQATTTDFSLSTSQIVQEYLSDTKQADQKYLSNDGDSKVIEITGIAQEVTEDFNNNKVILLKNKNDKAGVSCTFTPDTNDKISNSLIGKSIRVKGVIRSGATYDNDLDMYENVIMEKCDILKN